MAQETPEAVPEAPCDGLAAPEGWLTDGPLMIGELHGTEETPPVVLAMACHAAAGGQAVQLGLEVPRSNQPLFERFLEDGDTAALLASEHWTRPYQDGRSSVAVLKVLQEIRRLRATGKRIEPFAFDLEPIAGQPAEDRDLEMARAIEARWKTHGGPMIVLIGNLHARLALALPRPTGYRLQQMGLRPHSLLVESRGGEAWLCERLSDPQSCGPRPLGSGAPRETGKVLHGPTRMRGYDAELVFPRFTASPPAVSTGGGEGGP